MNENDHASIYYSLVKMVTDELSDLELAVLNLVAFQDANPHGRKFDYEAVASLSLPKPTEQRCTK